MNRTPSALADVAPSASHAAEARESQIAPVMPVRVLIADDHPVVLFALENLLSRFSHLRVVGRACTFSELFEEADRREFDVAVVDLHMPCTGNRDQRNAGDAYDPHNPHNPLSRFHQRFPNASLIVLTTEQAPDTLRRLLDFEVDGILSKQDPIDLIPLAIMSAMARERYVGPVMRELLARGPASLNRADACRLLSKREREVLMLYASGMNITAIAARLGRSIKTISAQKCSAMKKLALSNDAELYRFVTECGLESDPPA
jgi:DNA-binding NarL/FixJ family response regulator